jgi:pantoate--beta-alanine ligase
MTDIVRTVDDLRARVAGWKAKGQRVAVVPTMGALHEGHMTLAKAALPHAERVVVSIFVNPKQFAAHEDLGKYPRTEETDVAMLAAAGVDLVFAPPAEAMYAPGFCTTVSLQGPATAGLEDSFRPHFFAGVCTVVAKLFLQTQADVAMFGEKDYQQLAVVTQMAVDLDIPIRVVGVPTVREASGLAMSSRNRYLSDEDRTKAAAIHRNLKEAARAIRIGTPPQTATHTAARMLTQAGFRVDYVEARNAATLAKPTSRTEPLRLLTAAWLGNTRLIDNVGV